MEGTHSLAHKSLQVLRTLQAHISLKPSDVYTELYNKGDITVVFFPFPGVHEVASPVVGQEVAPLPHSSGTCRGDWLAMAEQSHILSHDFSMEVLHLEPCSRSNCFGCCCQLRKVLLHLSLSQLRLDQIFRYR